MLNEAQRARYARHISLSDVGEHGVEQLLNARVLIVGAGGLGSPAALYLAAAGVGTIGIMDDDVVSLSNLQRQIAHGEADLDRRKVDSAAESMQALNSEVTIETLDMRLTPENAADIFNQYDLILDCVDGLDGKLLINDTCVAVQRPFVHGSALAWYGQVLTYIPGVSPCYRCLVGELSQGQVAAQRTAAAEGIAGPLVGVIGTLQALEAVKYLTGTGELLTGRLLTFDGKTAECDIMDIAREPKCSACGGSHI